MPTGESVAWNATIGMEKRGFHALRRFRLTHVRKAKAPESLIQFWMGHSGTSITDGKSAMTPLLRLATNVQVNLIVNTAASSGNHPSETCVPYASPVHGLPSR